MKRLHHIDALRGLAALAVAYYHFILGGNLFPAESGVGRSASYGWLGVEVFFVISGFILPYTMAKGGYGLSDFGTFVKKRIVRLDPPYFVAIVLALTLWWVSGFVPGYGGDPFRWEPVRLALHLGYLNAFTDLPWYNPAFWTLAIEFQFYLLLALAFPLLLHRNQPVRLAALATMCGVAFLIPDGRFVFHYLGLFALGTITAYYMLGLTSRNAYLGLAMVITAITSMALGLVVAGVGLVTALIIAFVRIPELKSLTWLGATSYSLYLLHVPIGGRVINLGGRFADTFSAKLAVFVAALVASLVAAHLLYRFVERPSQRLSSSIRYRGREPQAEPSEERHGRHAQDQAVLGAEVSVP